METYTCYNNMMSSLRNLDLSCGDQDSFSTNNDHTGIYASHYSCFSPKPQGFDHGSSVLGPQVVDHALRGSQSHRELPYAPVPSAPPSFFNTDERMRISTGPGYSRLYNEASRFPGLSMPAGASPAYSPSYIGCSTMNQNGYFGQGFTRPSSNGQNGYCDQGQGFTQPSSNGQNGYRDQEFTETRSNGQNGYGNQEFTGRTNPRGIVSMAMRNEQVMVLQNAVVVELVRCMRIMNEILYRSLPHLEAKMAVPRDDQQTANRFSGNAHGSTGLTIPTRIFVGGLASTVTESDFKTYFDQFGTITNVEVKYDHFTQSARGFGFITFDSEKAVDKVLARTSFHELNGKMVEVKRAFPKDRNSIRGQLGGLNYGLSKVSNLLGAYTL
ncbi:uncharacterized protein LOC141698351 [Apium graveolens]|uniref:uncharacterized protein LOC141698351 n=1 Tax=Apium graveolens TaxID=4045 RepID=UPI003D78CF1B